MILRAKCGGEGAKGTARNLPRERGRNRGTRFRKGGDPRAHADVGDVPPRGCLVPEDWLDGIGVDRGVSYVRERLASWS